MQTIKTPKGDDAGLQQLWRQVCASRGTPAPDPTRLGGFIEDLGTHEREKLQSVLHLAARGWEQPGDLSLLSWAASCTRPSLLSQLQSHDLAFTSAGVFACGLKLREEGWDMQQRIAQLQSNPGDVDTLRAWLPVEPDQAKEYLPSEAGLDRNEETGLDKPFFPWPDDDDDNGLPKGQAPGGDEAPVESMDESPAAPDPAAALPVLPTRFARQRPDALAGPASAAGAPHEPRLRLRLFGKAAAHTLEVTPHRRGGDFLGVHVVMHRFGPYPGRRRGLRLGAQAGAPACARGNARRHRHLDGHHAFGALWPPRREPRQVCGGAAPGKRTADRHG